jgi:hypothetical protein
MDNLFTHGHRQLLGVQGSGLSAAWRRAAEDAARHPGTATDAPATSRTPAPGLRQFTSVFAVAVLAAVLVGALMQDSTDQVAFVAAPPASPALLLAAAE